MKNFIPLITAVLLGLATVFAVSKTMSKKDEPQEKKRQVLIVTSSINAGEELQANKINVKEVPDSKAPKDSIHWSNKSLVVGQRTKRPIKEDDYILYSDLELDQSKSKSLGDGQWGVPVTFADSMLLRMLHPGDDIAIIGTYSYLESVETGGKNADAPKRTVSKTVTTVLYPRVSVLEINGSAVLLSMPPKDAVALTAIQHNVSLYPLLRKKNDDNALTISDGGKFEDSALAEVVEQLKNQKISLIDKDK
jgi:Flp pilus assembly protein CpaB